MTTNTLTKPDTERAQLIASRIREARETVGMSRAQLAKAAGIPAKTVEKFEYGMMEPSLTRLEAIARKLNVEVSWLSGEEPAPSAGASPLPVARKLERPTLVIEGDESDPEDDVRELLARLDEFRDEGFKGYERRTLATIGAVASLIKFLEPEELTRVADARGLHRGECPSPFTLADLFQQNPADAQKYCGAIEERILDTAILGVDLFAIERGPLVNIATELSEKREDVSAPGFFGAWGEHQDFVPIIRPALREMAIVGTGPDFGNRDEFPRRR
ncbi:MAG: helix-turn-helix transcriptional regulator [Rhodospirillales bacterium]|nr:helix-turn-helix transcriptional regulator [Rhodospirillales bacterium]